MDNINRTIFGSHLQTCLLMKLAYEVLANSTLNERFSIQQGVMPAKGELPDFGYFVIGNGGHKFTMTASGRSKPEPIQHLGTDASCFEPLPFVLREAANDLSPEERAKYGLRRSEIHGGRPYFAYYARRIDKSNIKAIPQVITVRDGVESVKPFVPTSENLNPVPQNLSPTGVNTVKGDNVSVSAKMALILSESEINEIKNACKVLFDDEELAIISEVGLVSGVDKWVTSPGPNNSTINQNEIIAAQIISFVLAFYPLVYLNKECEILLDVGATEPLFNLE